jgi:threonine dehydratase/serine racemase
MLSRADVVDAAARIAPFVTGTPIVQIAPNVWVKAEHKQPMGAFKYRGATNAVQSLSDDDAARGVAAHSSGNHAAALALAASVRGIQAHVVMPENTPDVKRAAVEAYGARITWCEPNNEARVATLQEVLAATGAVEIHPFDNERVIAGAGTAALELLEEVPGIDVLVVPIGGGGLASGTCLAAGGRRVVGGHPVDRTATIADGLRTGTLPRTEAILTAHGVERVPIAEDDIVAAMQETSELLGEPIEPSAAVAFAAARQVTGTGAQVGIICSGGNVSDP